MDDGYVAELAKAVTGSLGGRVGVAPRIFLKKLVSDVLDRVDQFHDFDPRRNYALTLHADELTEVERNGVRLASTGLATAPAATADDVPLDL